MSTELATLSESHVQTGFLSAPANVYHAMNAVSQSRLKDLAKSPAHLRWRLDHPKEPTPAMRLGTMVHMATLEPRAFTDAYVVVPDLTEGITTKDGKPASNPRGTSEYKERLAAFARANVGREFVDAEDYDRCVAMAAAIRTHEKAAAFVEFAERTELSGLWVDEATGLLCKMRIDADCPELETIFDIKTTSDASRVQFEKSIFDFRYYWQAAMYLDGMAALGCTRTDYVIIAVESEPPHGVAVYRLKDEIIELARKEIRPLMALYKRCLRSNAWPSYPAEIQDVGLPGWAVTRIEKEIV